MQGENTVLKGHGIDMIGPSLQSRGAFLSVHSPTVAHMGAHPAILTAIKTKTIKKMEFTQDSTIHNILLFQEHRTIGTICF
jgi:hypothetical protein